MECWPLERCGSNVVLAPSCFCDGVISVWACFMAARSRSDVCSFCLRPLGYSGRWYFRGLLPSHPPHSVDRVMSPVSNTRYNKHERLYSTWYSSQFGVIISCHAFAWACVLCVFRLSILFYFMFHCFWCDGTTCGCSGFAYFPRTTVLLHCTGVF